MTHIYHNGHTYIIKGSTVSKGGMVVKDMGEKYLVLRKARNQREDRRVKR